MARGRRLVLFRGDRALWIIVAILCITSILVVYSSTVSMAYREMQGDTSFYVLRQFRFVLVGFFITVVVHWIEPRFYLRRSRLFFTISILMALLAYTPWFGANINGASRWFAIEGISGTILPSDPLKLSLVMVLAVQLGRRQKIIDSVRLLPSLSARQWREHPTENIEIFYGITRPILLPIFLSVAVVMPSNLSTSLIIFALSMVMLLVGRVRIAAIVGLVLKTAMLMIVVIALMYALGIGRAQTWVGRLSTFTGIGVDDTQGQQGSVDDEFQKTQAKIAIASGGIVGKGPGNSTQRTNLPHPYSDFAYAFIIEEYGVVGGIFILVLYLWVLYRTGMIMNRCESPTYRLLVLGMGIIIVISAFVNMAVSVGLFPVTGQSLPLISLGGTSVIFTSIAFGVILGVSRVNEEALLQKKRQRLLEQQQEEELFVEQISEELDLENIKL